jgi:Dyp-type peroxidase family
MAIDLTKPLDDTVLSNQEKGFMKHLQANILKGHGREHVALMFLGITDAEKARTFLRAYPVTDALTQFEETKYWKEQGKQGDIIRLAFLSNSGMNALGHGPKFSQFGAFSGGMANDSSVLDDGNIGSWQKAFKDPENTSLPKAVDVLLLLAYHDENVLAGTVAKMDEDFESQGFEVIFIQAGRGYRNGDKEGVEHFGYVDGRSQPLMIQSAIDKESAGGGIDVYNPTAPLGQFMLEDPLDPAGHGSFFVFRKLEQNVKGFKDREQVLATALGMVGDDRERAGAQVVGRFENGTPVTLSKVETPVPVPNNFDYGGDSDGSKCPFQGHIRKSNPRGSGPGSLESDKGVQMARRGITYGVRMQDPTTKEFVDKPSDGVGLLFMSYQKSIEDQFQFMQTQWVNNENFPSGGVGVDPVIGQGGSIPQQWCPVWGSTAGKKPFTFKGFVTLKYGEYFYAPSISGLKAI